MEKRASLMAALATARSLSEQQALVRRLDQHDAAVRADHAASRQLGFADEMAGQAMTPVHVAQQHTAATDWLADIDTSSAGYETDMPASAAVWFQRTSAAVKADPAEFAEQARGQARLLAGQYGEAASRAHSAFTRQAAIMWRGEHPRLAASGIPQIDQLIDPSNQPSPTPYPTEVFDNFQPPVHPVNEGIEDESGQGWASTRAPMIQTLEQMNGSGSGFGSGPEKPDEHTTDDDVDGPDSYAEIPLGQPGTLPAGRQAAWDGGSDDEESGGCSCCQSKSKKGSPSAECPSCGHMNKSHSGKTGSRHHACFHEAAQRMTKPDESGYQWPVVMAADSYGGANYDVDNFATPHHATCGADHQPGEACVSRETRQAAATCSKCHHPAHGDGACSRASEGCKCHGISSVTASLAGPVREPHQSTLAIGYRYNLDDFRVMEAQRQHAAARHTADDDSRPAYDGWQEGPVGDQDHDTWDTGEIEDRDAHEGSLHESARGGMRPHPRAVHGFGRMDALDGKPPVDPDTYKQIFRDASGYLHGHYMEGYNSVAAEMEGLRQRHESGLQGPPNFSRGAASGLVQVQEVVDANNKPDPQNDQLPQATMFPWHISPGDGQSLPGPEAAPEDVQRIAEAALRGDTASLRTWADTFTAPHQTTDDDNPVANSPATTPHPASGEAAAGARDGARDRAAGNRPTFSDASSHASEYVRAYSEAYAAPRQPQEGGDAPYSMGSGADSGQAANSQEAQQLAEVNKSASRRAAREYEGCIGCGHPPHLGQPCGAEGCDHLHRKGEEGGGPGQHARQKGHVSDPDHPGYSKPGGRKAVLRLTASRAFVPAEALPDLSFRQGYMAGRRYTASVPGVPPMSSPAFESGLYAGITDAGPVKQANFVSRHRWLARSGQPELMERISAHQEFSYRKAREDSSIVVRGAYIQAATSTDLETTAPGTSADPMGSTPLNGPGTPPPMQGGSDPARSGGPSPYQGAPPMGQGPVAPDPVMGDPQPAPPPAGEVMGGEGYSGYLNPAAYEGSPQGGPRRQAFRALVQANLAARR